MGDEYLLPGDVNNHEFPNFFTAEARGFRVYAEVYFENEAAFARSKLPLPYFLFLLAYYLFYSPPRLEDTKYHKGCFKFSR